MNDRRSFEQMLACYCAPVLKKHKAANMFHMDKAKNLSIFALIREYNEKLSRKQIQIKVLQPANSRITIFVFQTKKLQQILKRKDVMLFLQSFGYPLPCSLQTLFAHLEQRLSMASAYPHEIGVLLGYPLHDVSDSSNKENVFCGDIGMSIAIPEKQCKCSLFSNAAAKS